MPGTRLSRRPGSAPERPESAGVGGRWEGAAPQVKNPGRSADLSYRERNYPNQEQNLWRQ